MNTFIGSALRASVSEKTRSAADDTELVGADDRVDSVAEVEFGEYSANVRLDCRLAQVQLCSNLAVGLAARDKYENFAFASGQFG